jgi:uncharacterized phage protein (TIGR02218 family)
MSYSANEISTQLGAPVELYDFAQGSVEWHYTSSEVVALTVTGETYTSAPIERSEIEASNEQARNALKLTVPRDFPVAELFRVAPPSEVISITVRRIHRDDTTASPQGVVVAWMGRVLSCEFSGAKATLQCEPITVSLARVGLRRVYQVACPHVLYGDGCELDKADWDHATTVAVLSGSDLTVATINTAHSYAGGFVTWVNDDGITERRFIESTATYFSGSPQVEGAVLTLLQPFVGLSVSDSVVIYPGCDHTLTTCNTVFSNAVNYGGQPYFPEKNPFTVAVF